MVLHKPAHKSVCVVYYAAGACCIYSFRITGRQGMMMHHDDPNGILVFLIIPFHFLGNEVQLLLCQVTVSLKIWILL